MAKRYNETVDVEVDLVSASDGSSSHGAIKPTAFRWRGRRYSVNRLIKYWRESGEAWDPERVRDHEYFRVEAEGGTYDLRHDRQGLPRNRSGDSRVVPGWRLLRVWD